MTDDVVMKTEKDEEIKTNETNIDKSDNKYEKENKVSELYLDSLETLLLIHIIIKYEEDKNTFNWSSIKESLLKEIEKLKDLNITNNISMKSEEEIKIFYDKIQENFGKDNIINLEILLRNKRIEKIKNQIDQYNKQLKEKEEIIDTIKQNYLNELELEKQLEQEREKEKEKEKEIEKEKEKEKDEEKEKEKEKEKGKGKDKAKDKEKTNTTTTTTTTITTPTTEKEKNTSSSSSKLKRNQKQTPTTTTPATLISTNTNDDDEQKRREEEHQRASSKKILYTSMLKVWKGLNSNRFAYIFRYPITKDEAPDYDSVIKHRMDLTTLKKKLDDQVYNTCSEFSKDVILIFKNAMIYNQEDSDIYNMAASMKKIAEKEMEPCFATEELLQSGAANSLGTRSNRSGSNTPLSTSTSGNIVSSSGNGGGGGGGGSGSTMPSPSIRGRNKPTVNTTISANSSTSSTTTTNTTTSPATTTTTATTPRSKKNTSSTSSIASESDQSNPNTPSLQEETIDTSDHDSSTSKSKGRATRSSTRKSTTAESTPELKEDIIPIKKVSKRQRNSKTDETITHQDDL
ncbi:bromodomain-containing protein [Dictyostelium discoideum AX4]|uniref:Bromodomain-containing protein n=1 Tax=Dictyostelium discoideum TaxID=44689 RepID=Q86IX6_DICDI|nr:bromodomain-containing protein [Dictyostelium discoideum AX4]EAL70183.1 bromodomain-containing protein [Dictyostelium discoideum AX4]|eukprot:XP_643914.1 bromodomain-containing protein [Dictyostelium discoideum AX4]